MTEFKNAVRKIVDLKIYIEAAIYNKEKIEPQITDYLTSENLEEVAFKDIYLRSKHRILPFFDQLHTHSYLTRITLSNCGIGDIYFLELLNILVQHKQQINHIDVSQNDLTHQIMPSLNNYISDYESSGSLTSLVLDSNNICNEGLRELANGLFERFNVMEVLNKTSRLNSSNSILVDIQMPLDNLSLSNTAFTDFGFKYFL